MTQRYNHHVKRLTAFFVILAVLLSFFSLPVAGLPTAQTAETYTYTIDVFKYNATAITMTDISDGGSEPIVFTENTTYATSSGFKRLTFSSDKDALSVQIAGGNMDSCGAFVNGKLNLSKEYAHAYLVGGASSTLTNPSNPAVTFYMSATDDGTAKLTTVKNQNQGVQLWFEIGGAARKASGYSAMGGQIPIASTPEFVPYGEIGSSIGTTAGVHVRQTIPENGIATDINPGTNIWFAVRTAFAGSTTSSTFFGNTTTNTPVTLNAMFTMPGEAIPEGTYTYTIDVFKYNATAITMTDISDGGSEPIVFTENTTYATSNGFKRLTFSSDKDALSVQIAGGDMDSCGAFFNGKLNLSKEYAHAYLVGGASSKLTNPSNPAVTFYMSATDDGVAKLTTVKNQNQGVQLWFEIGGAARKASGYSAMGGQIPIASTPEFVPYGEVGSSIGTTAGVHIRQTIPENGIAADINPGTNIWFAVRTAFAGSTTSSTFFGNTTTNTPATLNALFTMPGEAGPDVTGINITPGSDESELCFAWLSGSSEAGVLTLWEDGKETETAQFYASAAKLSQKEGYLTNKVTVSGLKMNTNYYYTLTHGNLKSKNYTFSTSESADAFSFIMLTDAQIGKNGHLVPNEEVGEAWWRSIDNVTDKWKDISFMISAGDQVEHPNNENQYAMYLAPQQMRSIPIATTVGSSHDTSTNYLGHFNLPNMSILGSKNSGGTGGNYSFTYGEALFMGLNMCSNSSADILEHKQFMEETIDAYIKVNGKEPLWKIVFFHNSVYGAGDHKRGDVARRIRAQLSPVIAQLNIDAVFNGHEHAYTRSFMMGGQGNANGGTEAAGTAGSKPIKEGYTANGSNLYAQYTKTNPNETIYFTGNAASLGFSQTDNVLDFEYAAKIDKQAQVNGRGGRSSVIRVDVTANELSFNSYYTDVDITENSLFDSFTLKRERGVSHTVTFNKNGGDTEASPAAKSVVFPAETVVTLPERPTRAGYAFTGWNTAADGSGTEFTAATVVTEDITVFAQWRTSNAYNVTFNVIGANGTLAAKTNGNVFTGGTVEEVVKIAFTAVPGEGYQVKEWALNGVAISGNKTNSYTLEDITSDSVVTVEFELIPSYTVNFNATDTNGTVAAALNGNAITSGTAVMQGEDVVFKATPATGYRVDGWKVNGVDVSGNRTINYTLTNLRKDTTITAVFISIPAQEDDNNPPADGVIRVYIKTNEDIGFHTWNTVNVVEKDEETINMWQAGQIKMRTSYAYPGWKYVGYEGTLSGFTSRTANNVTQYYDSGLPVLTAPTSIFLLSDGNGGGTWYLDAACTVPLGVADVENEIYLHGSMFGNSGITLNDRRKMTRNSENADLFTYTVRNSPANTVYTFKFIQDSPNWSWKYEFPGSNHSLSYTTPHEEDAYDVTFTFTVITRKGSSAGYEALAVTGAEGEGWTYTVTAVPVEGAISVAVPAANESLVYDETEQIGIDDGTGYTVTNGTATNAGTYTATVTLKEGYEWDADDTTGDIQVKFTIARKPISVPAANTGLIYNGTEQTGVNAGTGYAVMNGTATNAGTYTATVTPDSNHQWNSGADPTQARTVQFTIRSKADAAELEKRIEEAQKLLDNLTADDIGNGAKQYPQAAVNTLRSAVKQAQDVANDVNTAQAEVDEAEKQMQNAIDAFLNSKNPTPVGIYGDVNGDGEVTLEDALIVHKASARLITLSDDFAFLGDVSGDGQVALEDALMLHRYVAKFPVQNVGKEAYR